MKRTEAFLPLIIALFILLSLVIAWHWLFPLLGVALALSSTVWGVVVATITILCAGIMFLFVLSGLWLLVVGLFGLFWGLLALLFFPITFPMLVPLLILLMFVTFIRRRQSSGG